MIAPDEVWVAEAACYIPGTGPSTLYFASSEFNTKPSETPPSQYFDVRLKQPALMRRDCFDTGTTEGTSRVGLGDLVLLNDDGALDALLNYGFDGRQLIIRQGTPGAAYPSGFVTVLVGTMTVPTADVNTITIKLRDRQEDLNVPLQPTKYVGNNSLPNGLEGVASDLKGKPKPILYGVVKNIAPPCVNTSKLIYQVNDGAINAVDAVYDRGVALSPGIAWSSVTSPFTSSSSIIAVCYGGGLFVAVGNDGSGNGVLATSPDGATWTLRTIPATSRPLAGVCYGNGLYVAAGGQNGAASYLITSPDGVTWTLRTSSFGTTAAGAVTYSSEIGIYCAVGMDGKLATSTDGITWTQRTSGVSTNTLSAVAAGNGLLVATAGAGIIITSLDGITWTSRVVEFSNTLFQFIAYSSVLKLFVMAGYDATSLVGGIGTTATSPDGITWTRRDTFLRTSIPEAIAVNTVTGSFVAVAADRSYATSGDGLTWFTRGAAASPFPSGTPRCLCYGNGVYVLGTLASSGAMYRATVAGYASLTDLQDDTKAPDAGTYKPYLAGGYFRLGSKPAGIITADVTQGATAADQTTAQIAKALLTRKGYTSSDYSAADITALDAADSSVVGFYAGEEMTFAAALDQVIGTPGAWCCPARTGVYRIKQLVAPSGAPVVSLTESDVVEQSFRRIESSDRGNGLPSYQVIVRWGQNYTVQATDLAAGVGDDRRATLAQQWREAKATDASVQTAHILAPVLDYDSCYATEAGAQAEATRRQTLRGMQRALYTFTVELNATNAAIDLGNVLSLTHSRFGFAGGKLVLVLGIQPDAMERRVTFTVWG